MKTFQFKYLSISSKINLFKIFISYFLFLDKMAKPIEPTPILEGKDAERLLKEVANATFSPKKQKFLNECREIYNKTK